MLGGGLLQGLLRAHIGTGQFSLAVQVVLGKDQSRLGIKVIALEVDDRWVRDRGKGLPFLHMVAFLYQHFAHGPAKCSRYIGDVLRGHFQKAGCFQCGGKVLHFHHAKLAFYGGELLRCYGNGATTAMPFLFSVAVAFFFRGRAATTGDEQKCDKKEALWVKCAMARSICCDLMFMEG